MQLLSIANLKGYGGKNMDYQGIQSGVKAPGSSYTLLSAVVLRHQLP